MPRHVIKAALEQLRHLTEENAANRVVVRAFLRETDAARNSEDIPEQEWPDGHKLRKDVDHEFAMLHFPTLQRDGWCVATSRVSYNAFLTS